MPNILPETKVRGSLLVDNIIPRAEDIPRARSKLPMTAVKGSIVAYIPILPWFI